ncbi:MAG: hypothetical protein BWY15_01854 [Firmicutes bacterium ADurb.Bin193]|nr:MAG: hypothetical protein BWY15_01854 [Firmicutes bacterium ADurb.Bin193]
MNPVKIRKINEEKQLAFGWANISTRANGEVIQDWQDDIIDISDLEEAAYNFVLHHRSGGEMHKKSDVAVLVESVVYTADKIEAMGFDPAVTPQGWWIGFKITDADVWEKVKSGEYNMFSIEGEAVRQTVGKPNNGIAKGFKQVYSGVCKGKTVIIGGNKTPLVITDSKPTASQGFIYSDKTRIITKGNKQVGIAQTRTDRYKRLRTKLKNEINNDLETKKPEAVRRNLKKRITELERLIEKSKPQKGSTPEERQFYNDLIAERGILEGFVRQLTIKN